MRFEETFILFRRVDARSAAAYALVNASYPARMREDHDAAEAMLTDALRRFDLAGDTAGRSVALNLLGHAARQRGELDVAGELLGHSLALRRELGELRAIALGISGLGLLALVAGDEREARARLGEADAIFRASEDMPGLGNSALHQGHLELDLGDPERAPDLLRRSIAITERHRIILALGWQHVALAEACAVTGDDAGCRAALDDAAAVFERLGDGYGTAFVREQSALIAG